MSGSQNNDVKRQFLLERLLDAVNQCQMRFGGRKEIALDSNSSARCALEGERRLPWIPTAEPVFWFYVKEVLNKHELQRFCSLHHITSHVGRGWAWLHCALNEHSVERYLHMLLADRGRLSTFCEDWSFVMDEQRSSMLPTMAAGLNSIRFANNIDNKDLNGQSKFAPTVSDLLKESTQNVTSLLKESTQGGSNLFREIMASSAVSSLIRPEQETDPLLVVSKHVTADARYKKERNKKKKVTNIISFDDEEDEQNSGKVFKKIPGAGESLEENSDLSSSPLRSHWMGPPASLRCTPGLCCRCSMATLMSSFRSAQWAPRPCRCPPWKPGEQTDPEDHVLPETDSLYIVVVLIIGIGGGITGRAKTGEFFEEFKKITVEGTLDFIENRRYNGQILGCLYQPSHVEQCHMARNCQNRFIPFVTRMAPTTIERWLSAKKGDFSSYSLKWRTKNEKKPF
ncbi:Sorting nexin-29 [Manis javanica]|nr:Sorting nexin-29 [Manis javanica]